MSLLATLSVRTDEETKEKVGEILKKLGLNHSTAINMYYKLILANQGLPFEVKLPNKTTIKAMKEAENKKNLTRNETSKELFDDLGI